jgi:hypothetical protein
MPGTIPFAATCRALIVAAAAAAVASTGQGASHARAEDVPAATKTVLKSESFGADPGWEGHRNHVVPKKIPTVVQDFGYSPDTNLAGKAAGEIGGRVQRAAEPSFYGAKLETARTLDDKLSASGTFAFTRVDGGAGLFFGWFNAAQPGGTGRPANSFGLNFDCEPTGARLAVFVITAQNQVAGRFITRYDRYRTPEEHAIMRPTPIRKDGTRYHWTLEYDPAAAGGNGQMSFTMKGDRAPHDDSFEGKTFTVDLPPGFKQQGTRFDHFGLMNALKGGGSATVHFDDVAFDGLTVDFAKAPGWHGARNRETYQATDVAGANDFLYRTTRRATGAAAGEIGGSLWRGPYAYVADPRVGTLTLNDRLEARGRLYFENAGLDAGLVLGWFNSETKDVNDKAPRRTNIIGVDIGGHTRVGHWFLPTVATAKGERHLDDRVPNLPLLKAGTAYEWTFTYDPAANNGNGQLRTTLGDQSATLDLKPGVKAQGGTFDRFGLSNAGTGGGQVKFYLDDLKYTARPAGNP